MPTMEEKTVQDVKAQMLENSFMVIIIGIE